MGEPSEFRLASVKTLTGVIFPNHSQRKHFIDIAQTFPNVDCYALVCKYQNCVPCLISVTDAFCFLVLFTYSSKYTVPGKSLITFFDVPSIQTKTRYLHLTQVLKARLDQRTTHPTIATPQDARRVLNQVSPSYRPPHPSIPEGFARAYVLPFNQQPVVTASTTTTTTQLLDEKPVRWPREALDRVMNDLQSSPASWSDEGKPVVWFQDRQPAPQNRASQPADQSIHPQGNPGLGRHEMGGPWPGRGRPGGSFPGRGRGRGQGLDTVQGGREWGPPNASHGFRERADRPPPPAPPSS